MFASLLEAAASAKADSRKISNMPYKTLEMQIGPLKSSVYDIDLWKKKKMKTNYNI